MVKFNKQTYGADVATILDNEDEIVEVLRREDGNFELTVHNRRGGTEGWTDLSAILTPEHFIELGKIADQTLCREQDCPSFDRSPGQSCKCHPRYGRA